MQEPYVQQGLTATRPSDPLISILIPMHNEENTIDPLFQELDCVISTLDCRFEIICVNDGSEDSTLLKLVQRAEYDSRLCIVDLSRNFGKEAALTAALDYASGDAVIPIDADLQDPPELIGEFIRQWREGFDVVYGVRVSRISDSGSKRVTARVFYKLFNRLSPVRIPAEAGDFRLMDRKIVSYLKLLPEQNRFMKGLFAWVGGHQVAVPFERRARVGGKTSWNLWKLWNFALDGITSFSTLPLRFWSYIGIIFALVGFLRGAYIIAHVLLYGTDVPGYASIAVGVLFLGGLQMLSLGIIGEYVGRIYLESKRRPVYIVSKLVRRADPQLNGSQGTCLADPKQRFSGWPVDGDFVRD